MHVEYLYILYIFYYKPENPFSINQLLYRYLLVSWKQSHTANQASSCSHYPIATICQPSYELLLFKCYLSLIFWSIKNKYFSILILRKYFIPTQSEEYNARLNYSTSYTRIYCRCAWSSQPQYMVMIHRL